MGGNYCWTSSEVQVDTGGESVKLYKSCLPFCLVPISEPVLALTCTMVEADSRLHCPFEGVGWICIFRKKPQGAVLSSTCPCFFERTEHLHRSELCQKSSVKGREIITDIAWCSAHSCCLWLIPSLSLVCIL